MLPNGELHVVSVRRGDESHSYHCRILVKPDGRTMTSSRPGRINLLPSSSSVNGGVVMAANNRPEKMLTVWSGQEAVLHCVNQLHHRINWYRTAVHQFGSLVVPVAIGGRTKLVGGTLVFNSVLVEDEGRYFCSSFNGSTDVASSGAAITTELIVRQKLHARITAANQLHLQMLVVDAGSKALITCSWSGSPK